MAQYEDYQDLEFEDDVALVEDEPEDNARSLTSGLVIATFAILLLAVIVLHLAMDQYHGMGFLNL